MAADDEDDDDDDDDGGDETMLVLEPMTVQLLRFHAIRIAELQIMSVYHVCFVRVRAIAFGDGITIGIRIIEP